MQFNQVNLNKGDVNNNISEKGNASQSVGGTHNTVTNGNLVQTAGTESTVKVEQAKEKESFWKQLAGKIKTAFKWTFGSPA